MPNLKQTPPRRWRAKKIEECCCGTCGDPLPEDDLRTQCAECRRWHQIREQARRQLLKDFGIKETRCR